MYLHRRNFNRAYFTVFFSTLTFLSTTFLSFFCSGKDFIYIPPSENLNDTLLQKRISLDLRESSFKSALEILNEHYHIDFVYVDEQIPWDKKVTIQGKQKTLAEILDPLVKNTMLDYFQVEDQIALTSKEVKAALQVDSSGKAATLQKQRSAPDSALYTRLELRSFSGKTIKNNAGRKLKTYYVRKRFSLFPDTKEKPADSTQKKTDTTLIEKKAYRKSLQKRKVRDLHISAKVGTGWASWKTRSVNLNLVQDPSWNTYNNPSKCFSFDISYEKYLSGKWLLQAGLGYTGIEKAGYLTSIRKNTLLPLVEFKERNFYTYRYNYVYVPLVFSYVLSYKKIYGMAGVGIEANFFAGSNMQYYSLYKTAYFTDLNLLSTKGDGNYYYSNGDAVVPQKAKYVKMVYSFLLKAEAGWKIFEHSSVFLGGEVNGFAYSIYKQNSPLKEVPLLTGIFLGYRLQLR